MRPLSTTAALVITGVLALLLIAYVFVGGGRARADRAPHCTSAQALDLVKAELLRRAAAIRGVDDSGFDNVANYSVVRAASRLVRRHHPGSDKVTCTGTLALDLPPGAAVVGGRRTLAAQVTYDLEPASDGTARLLTLSKADNIVVPLATVSNAGAQTAQLAPAAPQAAQPQPGTQPQPPAPQAAPPPAQPRAAAPKPPSARSSPPAKPAPAKAPRPAAPPAAAAPPPPPVAIARPSFNCRYARTPGEIAVCRNPALASLDRQMSAQYYSAVAAARPGQKAMLERSRKRFLAYRDSCGSDACIADAYRGRMREISEIMAGQW